MIGLRLHPVDTWFFRDGTPFTAESAPQEDVGSLFPPHPPTVVGALRAALARTGGWHGRGPWPREVCAVLGNGPDDLGALSFAGPFLLRDGQPLFRAPRHLVGTDRWGRWRPAALLRPGGPVACDLGDTVRLPELPATGDEADRLKAGDHHWLTATGMNAVFDGRLPDPDEVISSNSLWSGESRVGLKRNRSTRTAEESTLYSTRHVRLHRNVALGMRVAGLPPGWPPPFDQLAPLGGESRLADCREWNPDLRLEAPLTRIRQTRQVALVALSPLDIAKKIYDGTEPATWLGGVRIVSACLERPQRIGGWDSLARRPLPVRSVLPPGSVLFCEIPDPEPLAETVAAGGGVAHVGSRMESGFGLVAVGVWPDAAD